MSNRCTKFSYCVQNVSTYILRAAGIHLFNSVFIQTYFGSSQCLKLNTGCFEHSSMSFTKDIHADIDSNPTSGAMKNKENNPLETNKTNKLVIYLWLQQQYAVQWTLTSGVSSSSSTLCDCVSGSACIFCFFNVSGSVWECKTITFRQILNIALLSESLLQCYYIFRNTIQIQHKQSPTSLSIFFLFCFADTFNFTPPLFFVVLLFFIAFTTIYTQFNVW